jgi:hypothetical protein
MTVLGIFDPHRPYQKFPVYNVLAELSQLRAFFGDFAIIFVVKSCISVAAR